MALKAENCKDLLAIKVSPDLLYVDHMVIVTCRSSRHVQAVGVFIRKLVKLKMDKNLDTVPRLEGWKTNSNWIAVDLGTMDKKRLSQF